MFTLATLFFCHHHRLKKTARERVRVCNQHLGRQLSVGSRSVSHHLSICRINKNILRVKSLFYLLKLKNQHVKYFNEKTCKAPFHSKHQQGGGTIAKTVPMTQHQTTQ